MTPSAQAGGRSTRKTLATPPASTSGTASRRPPAARPVVASTTRNEKATLEARRAKGGATRSALSTTVPATAPSASSSGPGSRTRPRATGAPHAARAARAAQRSRIAGEPDVLPALPEHESDELDLDIDVGRAVSSLDIDHRPRTLRRTALDEDELLARVDELALTAGDVDIDPEAAAMVGDETPGGDNPTPDQDVVDLIGRSLGVEYADDEELEGGAEIARRDRRRWELDPASAEDWKLRNR